MARHRENRRVADSKTPGGAPVAAATELPAANRGNAQPGLGEAQAAAILTAIEHQLTRYFGAMATRADAVQQAGEAARVELVGNFEHQIDSLRAELDRSQQAQQGFEQALQTAIEERLAEFAASKEWRFGELEGRLERVREEISLGLATQIEAASIPIQQRFDLATDVLTGRVEELHKAARRFDEQSSALVQHINDTTSVLSRRLDETSHTFSTHLDDRTIALSQRVDEAMGGMRQHVSEHVATLGRRLEDTENKVIDRALAMEERINEQTGVRLAGVEATIGRISNGIDEAIIALSRRVIELENTNDAIADRIDDVASQIANVDQEAIDRLREQMSSSVGESMLVRIELERVASSTGEQFDTLNVRLAEVIAEVADASMDVSAAVQLERLEEIERALVELDPDQFVRKDSVAAGNDHHSGDKQAGVTQLDRHSEHPLPTASENSQEPNLSSW